MVNANSTIVNGIIKTDKGNITLSVDSVKSATKILNLLL